jgi:hypothetical protein
MQETDTYSPPGVALPSFAQDRAHGMMALRVLLRRRPCFRITSEISSD